MTAKLTPAAKALLAKIATGEYRISYSIVINTYSVYRFDGRDWTNARPCKVQARALIEAGAIVPMPDRPNTYIAA